MGQEEWHRDDSREFLQCEVFGAGVRGAKIVSYSHQYSRRMKDGTCLHLHFSSRRQGNNHSKSHDSPVNCSGSECPLFQAFKWQRDYRKMIKCLRPLTTWRTWFCIKCCSEWGELEVSIQAKLLWSFSESWNCNWSWKTAFVVRHWGPGEGGFLLRNGWELLVLAEMISFPPA